MVFELVARKQWPGWHVSLFRCAHCVDDRWGRSDWKTDFGVAVVSWTLWEGE